METTTPGNGNGIKAPFLEQSLLRHTGTDLLRPRPLPQSIATPEEIRTVKDVFGKVSENNPDFTKGLRGADQDFDSDRFWVELANHDNRLFKQYGKHYNTREEFTYDSLPTTLQYTIDTLEQRVREREILQEGLLDSLSGLTNKRYYDKVAAKRVARAAKSGREVSVLRIDVDDFKPYNDDHPDGHEHGDLVIHLVASKLLLNTRITDDVSRLGGDESGIILYGTSSEEARIVAERIQEAIATDDDLRKILPDGTFGNPGSLSIGITSLRGRNLTLAQLDLEADKAAYNSKKNGKARATMFVDGMQGKPELSSPATT